MSGHQIRVIVPPKVGINQSITDAYDVDSKQVHDDRARSSRVWRGLQVSPAFIR